MQGWPVNKLLFAVADWLSSPPGFYWVAASMLACTLLVPMGLTDVVTYALSVAAIVITGVVLIQGYRDTAAIHAKLDEIIVALSNARNEVVGLEHEEVETIRETVQLIEDKAKS